MSSSYLFDHLGTVEALLACSAVGLVTDFDGTLSPIVENPAGAAVSPLCREALRRLASTLELVALVSGRPVDQMREMVQVDGVIYVGNHGLQRWAQGTMHTLEDAAPFYQPIRQVLAALQGLSIPGLYLEDKGVSVAVHYRGAQDPAQARAAVLERVAAQVQALGLRLMEGKMMVEVRPPIEVHKGAALASLVREYSLTGALSLGDDLTDVDAFRALHHLAARGEVRGLAIAVLDRETPAQVAQEADLTLEGVPDVERFLGWLVEARAGAGLEGPSAGG